MILPLEKQVTSFKISREIEKLGVKQDSLWYWVEDFDYTKGWYLWTEGQLFGSLDDYSEFSKKHLTGYEYYSAFTVAELGKMLRKISGQECSTKEMLDWKEYKFDIKLKIAKGTITEANARGKCLVYLDKIKRKYYLMKDYKT